MNYKESRQYIEYAQKYGMVPGLDNMEAMLERLGNPQNDLRFVHIAGTNGKGSVLAYTSTVLKASGLKVGRYVSPTLYSYLERIQVNGEPIDEETFARHLTRTAKVIDDMVRKGLPHPTPFEIETVVAYLYFREVGCDLVVLEAGFGGLLDATNLITTTEVAVLTSISLDHVGILGDTLQEIARNKAGIIKPGCQVVTAPQTPEVMGVIESTARRFRVPLYKADTEEIEVVDASYRGQTFRYKGSEYHIALPGVYQIQNVAVALKIIEVLCQKGYEISENDIRRGLAETVWNGRFTLLGEEPIFIVDGAHNPEAAKALEASVRKYFDDRNIYYIMGMFKDKDYQQVAQITAPYAKEILAIAPPKNERALPAEVLAKAVRKYNSHVTALTSLQDAVEVAYTKAGPQDVIIAFGSLSFLGEITQIVRKRQERN